MGNNVFVSYKYYDSDVLKLNNNPFTIVRDYVDEIERMFDRTNKFYYRGEHDGEDLSELNDDTVRKILSDKIYYTSITVVLISPNMCEIGKKEKDQWIPWEISYSLKNNTRQNGKSGMNAVLAVALPDKSGSYKYAVEEHNGYITIQKDHFFKIIGNNMHNVIAPKYEMVGNVKVHIGECSYIPFVKWCDFCNNKDYYLKKALDRKSESHLYNIVKKIDKNW